MDPWSGNTSDPQSLHKYAYAHSDPINGIDPSGELTFTEVLTSTAIRGALIGIAIGAPFRVYHAAKQFGAGVDLGTILQDALIGVLTDAVVGAVLPGLFSLGSRFVPVARTISAAGQLIGRAANSVWNLGAVARGRAIEQFILGRVASTIQHGVKNFPVIDDFYNGVATSIKSIDLLAKTYQTTAALTSKIVDDAWRLAQFNGARQAGYQVAGRDIQKNALVVVMEEGAASQAQKIALIDAVQKAKIHAPFVELFLKFIP